MNFVLFSFLIIKFTFICVECIQQGDFISITEAPYYASLTYSNKDLYCGAAILSEYWIITAAHCVRIFSTDTYEGLEVRTGATSSRGNGSVHSIDRVVVHDDYAPWQNNFTKIWSSVVNDVSLIKVKEPIEFNEYQKPVKLRSSPVKENDTIIIVGLGYERIEKQPPSLKKTVLTVASSGPPFFANPPTVFHLQNTTSHVCPGDSGSPGVIDNELAGLVSVTDERCKNWTISHEIKYPGALTKIDLFYNWILEKTGIKY